MRAESLRDCSFGDVPLILGDNPQPPFFNTKHKFAPISRAKGHSPKLRSKCQGRNAIGAYSGKPQEAPNALKKEKKPVGNKLFLLKAILS